MFIDSYQLHVNEGATDIWVEPAISGLGFPQVRLATFDKPGEHGAILSNALYAGRRIGITGKVKGSTASAHDVNRRAFESAISLQRDTNGFPVARTLKFTTMDDLALQCDVWCNQIQFDRTNLTLSRFLIDFFCPDFGLLSQSETTVTLNVPTGGGAVYPIIYPIIYDPSTGGTGAITNQGTCPTYPVIYLNGPLDNPLINNQTIGRYMQLNTTIASGQTVVIDMKARTITLSGSSILGSLASGSQFFWLEAGSNTVAFSTTNSANTGTCQIKYRDAYIGI